MKTNYLFLFVVLSLCGCITYDPPRKTLTVFNNSDSAVYVCFSSTDSITLQPELKLFIEFPGRMENVRGRKMNSICSPDYRVNAYSYSVLVDAAYSTKDKWIPFKNKDSVTFFFIKESIMRTHTWKEIYGDQLYTKKIRFSYLQLENLDYEISYEP